MSNEETLNPYMLNDFIMDVISLYKDVKPVNNIKICLQNKWAFSVSYKINPEDIAHNFQLPSTVKTVKICRDDIENSECDEFNIPLFKEEMGTIPGFDFAKLQKIIYVPRNFLKDYWYAYPFLRNNETVAEIRYYINVNKLIKDLKLLQFPDKIRNIHLNVLKKHRKEIRRHG